MWFCLKLLTFVVSLSVLSGVDSICVGQSNLTELCLFVDSVGASFVVCYALPDKVEPCEMDSTIVNNQGKPTLHENPVILSVVLQFLL